MGHRKPDQAAQPDRRPMRRLESRADPRAPRRRRAPRAQGRRPAPLLPPTRGAEGVTVDLPTITAAELCARVQRPGIRCEPGTVRAWLADWARRGIVVELEPGRYCLSSRGLHIARSLALVAAPGTEPEAEAA